jgi:hypothetical protein
MQIRILILSFCLLIFNTLSAQIITLDAETNEPIPFVEIFNEEGVFLGNSDENGLISDFILNKIKTNPSLKSIRLQQMTYEKLSIELDLFLSSKKIFLKRKIIDLDELIVKPNNKKYGIILEGYYRGFQLSGKDLEYYSEGKIQIYYKNDFSYGLNKRIEERHYYNNKIKQNSNFTINMVGPIIPSFGDISKGKKVSKKSYSEEKNILLIENLKNDLSNPRTIKLLGNESIIYFENETYILNAKNESEIQANTLSYFKIAKNLKFKCKACKDFQDYSSINEFFVTDIKIIDYKPKDFIKFTGTSESSNFQSEFWKEAEKNPFFEPLEKHLYQKILNDLTLYPVK